MKPFLTLVSGWGPKTEIKGNNKFYNNNDIVNAT